MKQRPLVNRPPTVAMAGRIADKFYMDLRQAAKEKKPIAWITMFTVIPILRAMDIAYVFGDPFAATCASRHMERKPQEYAEKAGMVPEVCSYSRINMGNHLFWPEADRKKADPFYDIPHPDVFVCLDPGCHMVVWEYAAMASHFGKKDNVFYIQSPWIWEWSEKNEAEVIQEVKQQLEDLVVFLEDRTHRKMDWDRLREMVAGLKEGIGYRIEAMDMAAGAVPAPFSFYDWAASLAGSVYAAGTDACTDLFRAVRDEVRARVERKEGVIPNEKVRLFWEGHSAWPHLRFYSETFAKNDAVVVGGKYTHMSFYARPQDLDPRDPLKGLAANSLISLAYNLDWYVPRLIEICKAWKIDGIVGHFTRTCRIMCTHHFEVAEEIGRALGIPTMYVESDVADARFLSPEQTSLRIQAFCETIKAKKGYRS